MEQPSYSFRQSRGRPETFYRLTDAALEWTEGTATESVAFSDIRFVRLYHSPTVKNPFLGGVVAPGFARCVIHRRHARARILSSIHFLSFGKFEDRSASFRPFVAELMRRVVAARPTPFSSPACPLR